MLNIYRGRNEYPVKCQLLMPIYENNGKNIRWEETTKFIYCREIESFGYEEININGRRSIAKKGVLETISLAKEEIGADWKIIHDGDEYVIDRMTQEDDNIQQVMLKNCIIKTRLYLRG